MADNSLSVGHFCSLSKKIPKVELEKSQGKIKSQKYPNRFRKSQDFRSAALLFRLKSCSLRQQLHFNMKIVIHVVTLITFVSDISRVIMLPYDFTPGQLTLDKS